MQWPLASDAAISTASGALDAPAASGHPDREEPPGPTMSRFPRRPSRRSLLRGLGAAAMGLSFSPLLSGCGQSGSGKSGPAKGGNGEEAKLNFYNWDTYIGKTTLADFKAASGIAVDMTLFASNDELFAKLRGGNPGYDLIVP